MRHVVYLPTDWKPARTFPVLVELVGNGPYRSRFGDISTGEVEGSRLGYGRNHSDGWVLRPSPARVELRKWLTEVTAPKRR